MAVEDRPLIEGPAAERWRTLSEEVQRARHAGLATGPNDTLLAQAKEDGDGGLGAGAAASGRRTACVADSRFDEAVRPLRGREPDRGQLRSSTSAARRSRRRPRRSRRWATPTRRSRPTSGSRTPDLPGSSPARGFYEQGRIAAEARRDDDARKAFARAGEVKEEPGSRGGPLRRPGQRAIARLDAGPAAARPTAEGLAHELATALRRRDGGALRALASPTHFAVGLGGHFHFADSAEMLDRLEPDLKASEVHVDARALTGCGARRHVDDRRAGRASGSWAPSA